MKFWIKPIKGYENLTWLNEPDKRRRALRKCVGRIKALMEEKGISVAKIEEYGTYYLPYFDLYDVENRFLLRVGAFEHVNQFRFSFGSILHYWNTERISVIYDDETKYGEITGVSCPSEKMFLLGDSKIRSLYSQFTEYLVDLYKIRKIDLASLIETLCPIFIAIEERAKEIYIKTKDLIDQDRNLRQIPIIKKPLSEEQTLDWQNFIDSWSLVWSLHGGIMWIDGKLKFISTTKIDAYKGKVNIQEIPWFRSSKDIKEGFSKVMESLYIYEDIEKIPIETEETISEGNNTEKDTFTIDDFKEQMGGLTEFGIYFSERILENFYAGINSGNRFVILAGATGTGKTLLALIFPAIKHKILNRLLNECKDEDSLKERIQEELKEHLCFLRVAPNWTSPKDVLGYFNPINNEFIKGPL